MVIKVAAQVGGSGDDLIDDQGGELRFSWAGDYETGETVDRIKYVVAPNGIVVNEPTPSLDTDDDGKTLNGSMLNTGRLPNPGAGPQAFDGRLSSYNSGLLPAYPVLMRPGDALVKTKSKAPLGGAGTRGGVSEYYGGLHVVAAHPPEGAFGAPFIWPSADALDRPWRVVDLDKYLGKLPGYSSSGMDVEAWSHAKARIGPLDLGRALSTRNSSPGYEYLTRYFAGSTTSNYGRYLTQLTSFVAVGLMSDAWSTQEKTEALIDFLRMGCQFGESLFKSGGVSGLDGGHDLGIYAPVMAWLWATERAEMYVDWCTALAGVYKSQYFIVEEGQFDPHDESSRPYIARRRQVQAIENGGRKVTVNTYAQSGNTGGDWNKMDFAKLDLVRESDGGRAFIETIEVTFPTGPNDMVLHLTTAISGLQVNDTVYCAAPLSMSFGPGTPEWRSKGDVWSASPSPSAAYRNLQFPAIHHLFVHAIGMSGSVTAPGVAYLKRAMAPGSGLPSQVPGVFGAMFGRADWQGNNWTHDFWAAHSDTILNLPQDVG